ncbi:SLOG family protein [Ruminococcus sp. zg-924]|uniref:SLOG family protein n=1 Tax=Ruminococcus sp. zg-924 TaxID=2678505 RepID=UPI00210BBBA9|nr:SLOG family protein [Ruminococcus sp. zg-924]MCQ4022837.1 DUF1273 family protein [Ruminococcus sp. zg-924]
MSKACCGFGHREVFEDITERLDKAIQQAIEKECVYFYTGGMGEFDSLFSSAVRRAKKRYPNIKLICVKPYMTNEINKNHNHYSGLYYDDVIIPTELAGVHYKAAINKRNQWLVNKCDIIIGYIKRNYGGAFKALKYAEKQEKEVRVL